VFGSGWKEHHWCSADLRVTFGAKRSIVMNKIMTTGGEKKDRE